MNNFGYIKAMKVIFFSKYSKSYVDFQNAIKLPRNVDCFGERCVWTCSQSFCQLWQEYMSSAVNVLKGSPNIWDPTKRHDPQVNLCDINAGLA